MPIGYGRLIFVEHGNTAKRHDTIPEEGYAEHSGVPRKGRRNDRESTHC